MLYKDNITKRMGLEEAIAERVEETGTEHHIYLEMLRKEHPCPRCGERTNKIHDYREQKIRDLPAFGEKTFLHLRKRRYRCPECGKRFCERKHSCTCVRDDTGVRSAASAFVKMCRSCKNSIRRRPEW